MIPINDTIALSAQKIYRATRPSLTECIASNGSRFNGSEPELKPGDLMELDIVEQAVLLIDQMDETDWLRLLALSPHFHWFANRQTPTARYKCTDKVEADANRAIKEFYEFMDGTTLEPDQPFLDGFSLEQFYVLSEEEQDAIWTEQEEPFLDKYEERIHSSYENFS